jgi:secondary thiamine-phosphate synthase enzyme
MTVETHRLEVATRGNAEIVDLTGEVAGRVAAGRIRDGTVTVFVVGSTGAITTTEYEPGLVNHDFRTLFEKIAPEDGVYEHERTWHDDNGHSHVRASLVGPSLTVPVVDGRLTLGTWQQIVLMDFDTRSRRREIVVQVMGE